MQPALEMIEREVVLQTIVPGIPHSLALRSICAQSNDRCRELLNAAMVNQHSSFAVPDYLKRGAAVGRDNWFAVMHRFQKDYAESFAGTWQHKDIARFVRGPQRLLIDRAEKLYAVSDTEVRGDSLVTIQITPTADDHVLDVGHLCEHCRQGLKDRIDAFVLLARVETAN